MSESPDRQQIEEAKWSVVARSGKVVPCHSWNISSQCCAHRMEGRIHESEQVRRYQPQRFVTVVRGDTFHPAEMKLTLHDRQDVGTEKAEFLRTSESAAHCIRFIFRSRYRYVDHALAVAVVTPSDKGVTISSSLIVRLGRSMAGHTEVGQGSDVTGFVSGTGSTSEDTLAL